MWSKTQWSMRVGLVLTPMIALFTICALHKRDSRHALRGRF